MKTPKVFHLDRELQTIESFGGRDTNEGVLAVGTPVRLITVERTEDGQVWYFEAWSEQFHGWIAQRSYTPPEMH